MSQNTSGSKTNKSGSQPESLTANPFWESAWWSMNKGSSPLCRSTWQPASPLCPVLQPSVSFLYKQDNDFKWLRIFLAALIQPKRISLFLWPELVARSPFKPLKAIPVDYNCCFLCYWRICTFFLAMNLSRSNKICWPRTSPVNFSSTTQYHTILNWLMLQNSSRSLLKKLCGIPTHTKKHTPSFQSHCSRTFLVFQIKLETL